MFPSIIRQLKEQRSVQRNNMKGVCIQVQSVSGKKNRILVINPGATSTKIAVFDDETPLFKTLVEHSNVDLGQFASVFAQRDYRTELVMQALAKENIPIETLTAVVGRGGLLKPSVSGTYLVNEQMVDDLRKAERGEHASNLGAVIAYALAFKLGIPAFIVDPVTVDEMEPVARISGLPELARISTSHTLNQKAVARVVAQQMGKNYEDVNFIVVHLGTGISVTPHRRGKMVDTNSANEEGPFSLDRCGGLPASALVKLCYSGKYTLPELMAKLVGKGGMYAYLGTKDAREAEKMENAGDQQAKLVMDALAYQIAKEIGAMAAVLCGEVERIILTGGLANSKRIVDDIIKRIQFIAPIVLMPGEKEMEALAAGALRVLRNEEPAKSYQ